MSFWGELRRRNVFKVGAAYAIVAWLLIQVAAVLLQAFRAPAWVMPVFASLVILGFPLALVLAWAYEITPEGIKKTRRVPLEGSVSRLTGQRLNYIVTGLLVLAVAFLAVDNYVLERAAGKASDKAATTSAGQPPLQSAPAAEPPTQAAPERRAAPPNSVAVLPCTDLSPSKDDAYFAAGIHEEILGQLGKIRDLNVRSRTSVLRYADTKLPIPAIAAQLNVRAVMECSVRYADGRIRVTAQLIDAATDEHLWAESYERNFAEIFAIQADIAMSISNALEAQLSKTEQQRIAKVPTASPNAYALYLRAVAIIDTTYSATFESETAQSQARSYLDRAIEIDPTFALAQARKATMYGPFELDEAEKSVRAALDVDPDLGLAHAVQATISVGRGRFEEASQACSRAVRLSPKDAEVLTRCAIANAMSGRPDDASRLTEMALTLDPDNVGRLVEAGYVYMILARPADVERVSREAVGREPTSLEAQGVLGRILAVRGERTEAAEHLRIAEQLAEGRDAADPNAWAQLSFVAYGYHYVGMNGDAMRVLSKWEKRIPQNPSPNRFPYLMAALASGDDEAALTEINRAADTNAWYIGLAAIKANYYRDPVLDRPKFLAARKRLGFGQ